MLKEKEYIMWLSGLSKISHGKKDKLLHMLGSAEAVYTAPEAQLKDIKWLTEANIEDITSNRDIDKLKRYTERVYSLGADYIIKEDGYYPEILREAYDAPLGVYLLGDKNTLLDKKVSMVGTRKATPYGISSALKLAEDFALAGITVVSGMADGIDSASHRGALKGGGKTIAVLGCGINVCYPKTNEQLMKRIVEKGCVISEYPVDEKANPRYFPERNRIIAGLSMAVVVVEANEKGGSLITANLAVDMGREVFALPGNITSRASKGTNNLLKQGAAPITEAKDAFFAVGLETCEAEKEKKEKITLENKEKLVYDCINSGETALDDIIMKTGLDISEVQLILLTLEMSGLVKKLPASRYVCL
ncbi:MAG: DNA-processing protein DprA [Clostridiales bacterium]|nr:DNA-processing protein DprA [Clostridiales bacterium]